MIWISRMARTAAAAVAVSAGLSGCFGMNVELPPVTLTLPIASNATIPDILPKDDKLRFNLPPVCNLPDLAALEQEVRNALGPAGGLITIDAVTLNNIKFQATEGNFDFLDQFSLTLKKDQQSVSLSTDLTGQTNVTQFQIAPPQNQEVNILGLIPGPGQCLSAEVNFTGAIPTDATTYNATMEISILAILRL